MANKNLEHALYYASSLGWHVFPVYEMEGDNCSCGRTECKSKGKHPRFPNGLNIATTDITLIDKWWELFPNSNIGVRTGEISGFLVVDIDGEGELPEKMPSTVCQTTGSGGQHLLYKYPNDGLKYKSGTHIFPSVDSRADGGYIVVAPSNHKSGDFYTWDVAPTEIEMADAPSFWLDKIRFVERNIEHNGGEITIESDERIESMLQSIDPDCDYDTWVKIGMSIHSGTDGGGFNLWNDWSMKGSKYDGYETLRIKWGSFGGGSITISTLHHFARENNWIDENMEIGKAAAHAIFKSEQMKIAEIISTTFDKIEAKPMSNIFPKKGLLKEISDYILETSQYEQPELAIGAAISLVASVAGRKYTTITGASTCLYVMGVADTSMGKGHAVGILKKILFKLNMHDIISGEPASGSAMYSALHESPNRFYLLDEIGDFFGRIMSPKASQHEREIKAELLKFYSEGQEGGIIKGKDRADRKLHKPLIVHSPNVVIYGATTGETFYSALSGGQIRDGFLSRITLIDAGDRKPIAKKRVFKEVPEFIISKLSIIRDYKKVGNLVGAVPPELDIPDFHFVEMSDEIIDTILDFTRYIDEIRIKSKSVELYGRTSETAVRLAMIYAISLDPINPILDDEAFDWGKEFALWCTNTIINQARNNVSDSLYDKTVKDILGHIKKAGRNGITKTTLSSKAAKYTRKERNDAIDDLIERMIIKDESVIPITGKGAPQHTYYYIGGDL